MKEDEHNFYPCHILKIYRQDFKDKYYIEIHNVMREKTTDIGTLSAGRPLQKKTFQRLLGSASDIEQKSYFQNILLDPRLLACEPAKFKRHILWYDKAGPKRMIFTKDVKTKTGMYSMPALLYFAYLDKIKIFAMKTGNKRPDQYTKLYFAPLFNQIENHELCWGSVKKDTSEIEEIDKEVEAWDNYLWQSRFSEYGGIKVAERAIHVIYKEIKNGTNKFPGKDLRDADLTITGLFNKYL